MFYLYPKRIILFSISACCTINGFQNNPVRIGAFPKSHPLLSNLQRINLITRSLPICKVNANDAAKSGDGVKTPWDKPGTIKKSPRDRAKQIKSGTMLSQQNHKDDDNELA